MVKVALQIKAYLTNIDKLYPFQPDQFCWPVKVKCTGCGEENPNWHLISKDEVVTLKNGEVHFLYKCKCCSRENSLSILPNHQVIPPERKNVKCLLSEYTADDDGQFRTMIAFDCRGLELTDFEARDGWAVQSGNKLFEDVDLTEKDWVGYNDLQNVSAAIEGLDYKYVTIK